MIGFSTIGELSITENGNSQQTSIISILCGLAIESNVARSLNGKIISTVGTATEADLAKTLSGKLSNIIGIASEIELASSLSGKLFAALTVAIELDTALSLSNGSLGRTTLATFITNSISCDLIALLPNSVQSTTINVSTATMGDPVIATLDISLNGTFLTAYVSSPGVVTINLINLSQTSINLPRCNLMVLVTKLS